MLSDKIKQKVVKKRKGKGRSSLENRQPNKNEGFLVNMLGEEENCIQEAQSHLNIIRQGDTEVMD